MNWSKYNIVYKSIKHGYLLFNTMSGVFLDLNDEGLRNEILEIRKSTSEYDFSLKKKLKDFLLRSAIICKSDEDNIELAKFYSIQNRFDKSYQVLTIIPTLHCNLQCTYCYEGENLKNEFMSDAILDELKKYIKEEYQGKVEYLSVQWYGGEPLLAFDKMLHISYFLESLHIPFHSSIVTNGCLLTKEKIEQLERLHVKEIQLTIDGMRKTHDKKRKMKNGNGTYDIILGNMELLHQFLLRKKDDELVVNVRVNVDKENCDEFHLVSRFFGERFPKFVVYPGILMQYTTCTSAIPCFENQKEVAEFYIDQYEKYGLENLSFYPILKGIGSCMAESPYNTMIGPEGEFYLCLKDVGDQNEIIGNIFQGKMNFHKIARYATGSIAFDDKLCRKCKVLTLCGGGCPNITYRNEVYNENNDRCAPYKEMAILKKYLDIHYEMKKKYNAQNN